MSDVHICSTRSLSAGVDLPAVECPLCLQKTLVRTWVDSECGTCGLNTERYVGENLMVARRRMGLTRKQFGELIGYKPATVKKYEWTNPSSNYIRWCEKIIREHYQRAT